MKYLSIIIVVGLAALNPQLVSAQISEVRVGIAEFSEDFINPGTEIDNGVEQSLALQGEIIIEEPKFLKWALSPQPYVNATLNLEGNTNHTGVGLLWRQGFGKKLYGDFAFGFVVHDGTKIIQGSDFIGPGPTLDFEGYYNAFETEREFGTRLLFREQVTLGYRINEDWAAELFFEHLSNGLGSIRKPDPDISIYNQPNDAVDSLGLRVAKRF